MPNYSDNPKTILEWAKKPGKLFIPLHGTGGASIQAVKADFIVLLKQMIKVGDRNFESEFTQRDNGDIWA